MIQKTQLNQIKSILKKNKITKAGIFGSYSRGEERLKSDIDILVKLPPKSSLFTLSSIETQLETQLNKKVDLLTYNSINSRIKKQILKDEIRILG